MGQPEKQTNWQHYYRKREQLSQALDDLKKRGKERAYKKYGLSREFVDEIANPQQISDLCAEAMKTLETQFVSQVEKFLSETSPEVTLKALEEAETIWQSEMQVISRFDTEGEETSFLMEMRGQIFHVASKKLESVASQCKREPSQENIGLCIAILGLMDTILAEMGDPKESTQRKQLKVIATSFFS